MLWLGHDENIIPDADVNSARLILISLICAVPAILLLDGPILQGLIPAILAVGIAVVAGTIRQGEAGFLLSSLRPVVALAVIPAAWMLIQIVPLQGVGLAHPIWQSAAQALGHPISGSISIDPGATVLALGRYLSALAVMLLAAAVGGDRGRAEGVLFALTAATALVALVMIGHDFMGLAFLKDNTSHRAQARACAALGIIVSAAACIRSLERYETSQLRADRSTATLTRASIAGAAALALCAVALMREMTGSLLFAIAYGLGTLIAVVAIRRIGLGLWGRLAIATTAAAVAVALIGTSARVRATDLALAFARGQPELVSASQRMLADAPWMGTGAGTFAALLPIYRDAGDAITDAGAPTAAAAIAIELGRPMLGAIVVALTVGIVVLLRGAFQRGRDSFYPAAGAGSALLLLLLSFCDNGVLGSPVAICAAAILGLAFVQRQGRASA